MFEAPFLFVRAVPSMTKGETVASVGVIAPAGND